MATGNGIPMRDFGRTGVKISALGLGGHHLGDPEDESTARQIVHMALDGGVNFFDNCWEYHRGKCEDWLGAALKGHRQNVFLMTKVCTHGRDKGLAMKMLEESLRPFRPIIWTSGRSTASHSRTMPNCSFVPMAPPKRCGRRRNRARSV